MTTLELLQTLQTKNIKIWAEAGKLKFRAPEGVMNPDIKRDLKAHKAELLSLLEGQNGRSEAITVAPRDQSLPASMMQNRLWFLDQMTPGTPIYNIPLSFRLRGDLNIEALSNSLNHVIARHEALRTTFVVEGDSVVQKIAPTLTLAMPIINLSNLSKTDQETAIKTFGEQVVDYRFDLEVGPLLYSELLQLAGDEFIWLINMHHIISDAWSVQLLLEELSSFYEAELTNSNPSLPPLPIQYADYAAWQQACFKTKKFSKQLAYWQKQLTGAPRLLALPTDRVRPSIQTYQGDSISLPLPADLLAQLRHLNSQTGTTLFMTLLSTFKLLMARLSGQNDILVGIPIAGRNRYEIEKVIGFFINSLALRTCLSPEESYRELLEKVRNSTLDAYANQDIPFEQVIEMLKIERSLSHTPLFQVFFNMFMINDSGLSLSNVSVEQILDNEFSAKFDMTLYVREQGEQVSLRFVYNKDLFAKTRIAEMASQYKSLLAQTVAHPDTKLGDFSLQTKTSKSQLPNPTLPLSSEWMGAIQDRLTHHANLQPENTAVVDKNDCWTYAELEKRSNQLAHYLRQQGVQNEDIVAIYAHRSASLVWAIMAVLKAGAAYTILDPAYPATRQIVYIEMAKPSFLLQVEAAGGLPKEVASRVAALGQFVLPDLKTAVKQNLCADLASNPPQIDIGAESLAALSFTSGSTGLPKGVLGRHGPLTHFLPWQTERMSLTEADRFSMVSGLAHDPLQRDIFTTIWVGAQLHIPEQNVIGTPGQLADWFTTSKITFAHLTPPMVQMLVDTAHTTLPMLRYISFIGDKLTRQDILRTRKVAPSAICLNSYGSTETQRAVSYHFIAPDDNSWQKSVYPLGKGIPDSQLLLLNQQGHLAGIGEVAEIYMRSPHLARGYLENGALTAARFITNPFTNQANDTLYRTGDLGRYLPDGQVVFVGRADRQVKIRGYRIEPGEIEAVLTQADEVNQALVIRYDHPAQGAALAAYVLVSNTAVTPQSLRAFIDSQLPNYMIPHPIIFMNELPLTPNGKLDIEALPDPLEVINESTADTAVFPRTQLESELAKIWADVLGLKSVGVTDNFFEMGGHSLLAVSLFQKIEANLGKKLPFLTLFQCPTVAEMAQSFNQLAEDSEWNSLVTMQSGNSEKTPFFYMHGLGGGVVDYGELTRLVGEDQPAYGILAQGVDGKSEPHKTIEAMAQNYIDIIRNVQPTGPYLLGGYCYGGVVAFEVARQFEAAGESVEFVAIFEGYAPLPHHEQERLWQNPKQIIHFLQNIPYWLHEFQQLGRDKMWTRALRKLRISRKRIQQKMGFETSIGVHDLIDDAAEVPALYQKLMAVQLSARRQYQAGPINGRVALFRTRARPLFRSHDPRMGWQKVAKGGVSVHMIAGEHFNILERPYVESLATTLRQEIDDLE